MGIIIIIYHITQIWVYSKPYLVYLQLAYFPMREKDYPVWIWISLDILS